MTYVILDTEYTTWPGSLENGWKANGQHREIVQIAAVRVDGDFREIEALEAYVRPLVNPELSDLFTELTGITQATVDKEGYTFHAATRHLDAFVQGEPIICMNGDCAVFFENCGINGMSYPFKGQFHRLRPLLEKAGVDLTSRSSGTLHELTPTPLGGHVHNALHDVRSMAAWLSWAKSEGVFTGLEQLPRSLPIRDARSLHGDRKALDAAVNILMAAGRERGWFVNPDPKEMDRIASAMIQAATFPDD